MPAEPVFTPVAPTGTTLQRETTRATRPMAEVGIRASLKAQKQREKTVGLASMVALCIWCGLAYLVWFLYTVENQPRTEPGVYDPAAGLTIITQSCDVHFVPGTDTSMTYVAAISAFSQNNGKDTTGTYIAAWSVNNLDGCDGWPRGDCSGKCLVTVNVPPEAKNTVFTIRQASNDAGSPKIKVLGASIGGIDMGADHTPTVSAALILQDATVSGTIGGYLLKGSMSASNSLVGDFNFVAVAGTIILTDQLAPRGGNLDIKYRANSLCLSSDLADNTYADLPSSENNAWLYCDYGKILSGESTNKDLYGDYLDKLRALYDPNSDGYVSDTEARNGLTSVGCFGPDCPFGNDPDQVTYQLGLGAVIPTSGNSQVLTYQVAEAILATNHTGWVPDCKTHVRVTSSASSSDYATQTPVSFTLLAAGGELVVQLKQSGGGAISSAARSTFGGTPDAGVFMIGASAAKMLGKYASRYGDIGSTEDIFLAMDVVGSPGVPKSRWVYTTNPVYLHLDTARLDTFSPQLAPTMAREKVIFEDKQCWSSTSAKAKTQLDLTYAEIQSQLTQAFRSNPKSRGAIRGVIVMLNESDCNYNWLGSPSYITMVQDGDAAAHQEAYVNAGTASAVDFVFAFTYALAVTLGLLCVYGIWAYIQFAANNEYQKKKACFYTLLRKSGLPHKSVQILSKQHRVSPPSWNAFFDPMGIVTDSMSGYLTGRYLDTLGSYVNQRTTKVSTDQFVYMGTFIDWYELFCLQHGLKFEHVDHEVIQRRLIKDFDIRIQQIRVTRLYGLVWKGPNAASQDDTAKTESPRIEPSLSSDAESPADLLKQFVTEKCEVDLSPGVFIDFKTRNGPSGRPLLGFAPELFTWCKAKGVPPPDINDPKLDWGDILPRMTSKHVGTVTKLNGLALKTGEENNVGDKGTLTRAITGLSNMSKQLSKANWKVCFIATLVQVTLFCFVPMCALLTRALTYQDVSGWINAPAKGVLGTDGIFRAPLGWGDIQQADFGASKVGSVHIQGITAFEVPFVMLWLLSIPRLLTGHLGLIMSSGLAQEMRFPMVINIYYHVHGLILGLSLLFLFMIISKNICWTILAACIFPASVAPVGIGVISAVYAGCYVYMGAMARLKQIQDKIEDAFDEILQQKLRASLYRLEAKNAENGVASTGANYDDKVTAKDLFLALDSSDNDTEGTLDMADIESMFESFELNLSDHEKDRFFAYCDIDVSGRISAVEFQAGWDQMMKGMVTESLEGTGVTRFDAIAMAILAVVSVVLLAIFVILGVNAFSGTNNVSATLQSTIILFVTRTVTHVRSTASKESGELNKAAKDNKLVTKVVEQQKAMARKL